MGGGSSTRAICEAEREAEWKLFIEEQQRKLKEREDALQRDQEKLNQVLDVKKEIETRRDCVKEYKPGESMEFSDLNFPDILNVGLFGTTGIGKTSLLNSLKYAVNGELKELHREQVAPADYQGGHSVRRLAVRLTKHIAFIDNRGVGAEDLGAPGNTEEMISQLEGRSSFAQPIVWREENPVNKLNTTNQHHRNRIYCAVLVFDARKSKAYFEVASKFVDCLFKWQAFTMSTSSDDDTIDLGVLNDYVEQALPSLSVSARSDVIDKLLRLGVETPSDLHFLDEDDLKSLKKIHVRKLLQASTKEKAAVHEKPTLRAHHESPCSSSFSESSPDIGSLSASSYVIPWDKLPHRLQSSIKRKERPLPADRREMVRILTDLTRIYSKPTRHQLATVASKIVLQQPASFEDKMDGIVIGSGYGSLLAQMEQQCQNNKRKCSSAKRCLDKSESPSTGESNRSADEYETVELPENENEETQEEKRKSLQEMYTREVWNKEEIKTSMAIIYPSLRKAINSCKESVQEVPTWQCPSQGLVVD